MSSRRSFTNAGTPTTTAHELSTELAGFAASLKETAATLEDEIGKIARDIKALDRERDAAVETFVDNTVTDLQSEHIEVLSDMAAQNDEVRGQSLRFVRNEMVQKREEALAEVNAVLAGVTDADGAQRAIAEAGEKAQDAANALSTAKDDAATAERAQALWAKAPEYKLVKLSGEIQARGGLPVNQENRAYYEPKWLWTAAVNYVTRDSLYREVRKAIVAYGHEEDGKDAFADVSNFEAKTAELGAEVNAARGVVAERAEAARTAQAALDRIDGKADDIVTDMGILERLRKTAAGYLSVPSYVAAVAAHYAEDFPQGVPLLAAKVGVLEKLRAGAEEKLAAIRENIVAVVKQQADVAKLRAGTELRLDIEEVRRRNAARSVEYGNYTTATRESWDRTRNYDYSYNQRYETTVDRSGPSVLEWMLIMHILNDDNGNRTSANASYTTDMLKLDRQDAVAHGIPDQAFEISPEVSRRMEDLGITHYESTGTFSFDVNNRADDYVTSHVSEAVEAVRESVREAVSTGGNFSFDSAPRRSEPVERDEPSYSSPRHS